MKGWSLKDAEMVPYDASVELDFSCGRQRVAHCEGSSEKADWLPVRVWKGAIPISELDEELRDWRDLNQKASVPYSVIRELESYYYLGTDKRREQRPHVLKRARVKSKKKKELFTENWQPIEREADPVFVKTSPTVLPPRDMLGLCSANDVQDEKLLILPRSVLRQVTMRLRESGFAMAKEATKGRRRIRCLINPTWPNHFILWSALSKA